MAMQQHSRAWEVVVQYQAGREMSFTVKYCEMQHSGLGSVCMFISAPLNPKP